MSFAEKDPAHRRALIDEFYTEDCVFYDPNNCVHRGRDEIDRIAPSPMCRVMVVESDGFRVSDRRCQVKRSF